MADYFENTQWAIDDNRDKNVSKRKIFSTCADFVTTPFVIEELDFILKKCKNNKSPGPDGIPLEFFKWLDPPKTGKVGDRLKERDSNNAIFEVLEIINTCWTHTILPSDLEFAEVVTLYKKGKVEDPANYRPIALLDTLYKILTSLIQTRMANAIDERISQLQFGFRKKRSTSQPLFIARRIQDFAEASGDKLFLVFLDWEKAFDKIDQQMMIEAIERLNVPSKLIDMLKAIYKNPQFCIRDSEGNSTWRKQRAGIRQGCPLSPYLFICLMTVMFDDIHTQVDHKIAGHQTDCFNYWELIYADDTMLIGNRARELNILLAAIETECAKYNLKLNYNKCNYIAMNGKAHIHFKNMEKLKEVDKATYLGGTLTNTASRNEELNNRISKALTTCNKLKTFWYKTKCSHKWKLQVYNAIIVSQLTYGLSTVQLTPTMLAKLDAFQMRGLRYILKIEHSFYSHVTNEEVYEKANIALNKGKDLNITWEEFINAGDYSDLKYVVKLSDYVMRQQNQILGHLIRAPNNDLMRRPAMGRHLAQNEQLYKRSGGPRMKWVGENCKYAYKRFCNEEFTYRNPEHIKKLTELAENRNF